jgi:hypothetical protein
MHNNEEDKETNLMQFLLNKTLILDNGIIV